MSANRCKHGVDVSRGRCDWCFWADRPDDAIEEIAELREHIARSRASDAEMRALAQEQRNGYLDEIERLRALIKQVERGHVAIDDIGWTSGPRCPWCGAEHDRAEPHADDCPAFTPEGEVR